NAQAEGLLEVYEQAEANAPGLKAAAANFQADQEIKDQAEALLLPNIGANASANRNFDLAGQEGEDFDNNDINVNLRQTLYNRQFLIQNEQADTLVDQAEAEFVSIQQNLVLDTAQRYFAVLSAVDDLSFAKAELEAIDRQLEQAQRRFEVGLITITDVYEAQARYDLALTEIIRARNQLADTLEALAELTGQYYDTLQGIGEDKLPLELPEPSDLDFWVEQALRANPDLVGAVFGVEAARDTIALRRAERYPRVDLVGNYNTGDDTRDFGGGFRQGATVGVQVNVDIFEGGAISSRTQEAAYRFEAAKQTLEAQQRDVTRQTRNAYRNIVTSISSVNALEQARVTNLSALEATEAGFDVGTRTIVDVLDAQRELFRARRDFSQARYTYLLNRLSLARAAGQLDEEELGRLAQWLDEPIAVIPEPQELNPAREPVVPREFQRIEAPVLPDDPLLPLPSLPETDLLPPLD
ncbi:MAG: TolC family outer membrane protein, partial [Candidatus Competibacteraceae bacterium]|nr:TolC family outer membrane protein [Candidatus Competibacteraceae bacterium]